MSIFCSLCICFNVDRKQTVPTDVMVVYSVVQNLKNALNICITGRFAHRAAIQLPFILANQGEVPFKKNKKSRSCVSIQVPHYFVSVPL